MHHTLFQVNSLLRPPIGRSFAFACAAMRAENFFRTLVPLSSHRTKPPCKKRTAKISSYAFCPCRLSSPSESTRLIWVMVLGSRIVASFLWAAHLLQQLLAVTEKRRNGFDGHQGGRSHSDLAYLISSHDIAGSSYNFPPSSMHHCQKVLSISTRDTTVHWKKSNFSITKTKHLI